MNIFLVVLVIVIISTVVGAVARLLNNLNEMNAAKNQPPPRAAAQGGGGGGGGGAGAGRQGNTDMDRFLAEIDRLRRKNADAPAQPANQAPAAPVVQPAKQPDRPKPRVVAELADPSRPDSGFAPTVPTAPTATSGPKAGDLPVASVVAPPSGTGAPATRVTRLVGRARPIAKTPFAKSLTTLLASGHGLATAIVLQEILGPPRCKKG